MKCHAVIDTNVLVSALLSKKDDAPAVLVMEYILDGTVNPVFNNYILAEYDSVLRREKFGFDASLVTELIDELCALGELIETIDSGVVLPDMKDVPFYEVARQYEAESIYLVTGNVKHFPVEPLVVTPRQMLEIITGKLT
ncbi:MAG: putative toxin-antitoxin system toxin component, PIN family [Lentisphaerae bacterium]|mgnify:FL=1|jgi:putative PIN family toxin of toxin-antitoxin system|nr:putative toxin-antitoxin system toxin component, PIN family [Lentisphaerota bacterium]